MRTFTDTKQRDWLIHVTVDAVKRVRGLVNVDLLDVIEQKSQTLTRLITDPILLADVIYAVCKPQADERRVTDTDFAAALAGDPIDAATHGLLDSIVDFFPNSRDRDQLRRVIAATWGAMDQARTIIEARLAPERIADIVSKALETAVNSSTDAPESSASTPDP